MRWILGRDLRGASRADRLDDLIAGSITAVLLVPQALAYAALAGLPAEVGLYASILPPIVYALLGSSRTLAVGPVAVAAVMVASALYGFAGDDSAKYLAGAALLALLGGGLLLAMALLRLGWLTHFISHPVLSGFVTGAAIFIVGTQVAALMGIPLPPGGSFAEHLLHFGGALGALHLPTLTFGAAALALLLLARQPLVRGMEALGVAAAGARMISRMAPLAVVLLATLVSLLLDAEARWGLRVVGQLEISGLDIAGLAGAFAGDWWQLLPSAALIALIGYVESVSVARTLALRRRQAIDPDQELLALGGANIAAAVVSAMPVAGGFSRSMVNFDAGARSQLAAVVTSLWILVVALFLGGALAALPRAVLAAIIIVAVWQLIDLRGVLRTWRFDAGDGFAQGLTLVGVLVAGIEAGLLAGVGAALGIFLFRTSRPHIAIVGRVPGTEHFRNVHRHVVETWPELLLIRVDESLYFASSPRVQAELQRIVSEHDSRLAHVVLILSGVNAVDASGEETLEQLHEALAHQGVSLHLAEVKGPVHDHLRRSPLLAALGEGRVHLSAQQAVQALLPA